jgi:hypothetical protein
LRDRPSDQIRQHHSLVHASPADAPRWPPVQAMF